jgi:hypothetical protein
MRIPAAKLSARALLFLCLLVCGAAQSRADIALLLEEPHGQFGAFNPTGHAAVYLSDVCAETPTKLRECFPGEQGVVISRYHRVAGYDWIAVPLIAYVYAVPRLDDVPSFADAKTVARLRDEYRREFLQELIPDGADGSMPRGDWIQLVGAAYDRKMYVFQIESSREQDRELIEHLNAGTNHAQFNLFYRNCSDFAKKVFSVYYPGIMRRNFIADAGITTPKQIAKSLVKYAKRHPDAEFSASYISQVPGTRASKPVHGVLESIVRSKKYLVPLAFFHPVVAGSFAAGYLVEGRFNPNRYAKQSFSFPPENVAGLRMEAPAVSDNGVDMPHPQIASR